MPFVTVLVQHAWALQPASGSAPGSASRSGIRDRRPQQKRASSAVARRHPIRLAVPQSVAAFVRRFNAADTPLRRRAAETTAQDILDKLEHLVLAPAGPAPVGPPGAALAGLTIPQKQRLNPSTAATSIPRLPIQLRDRHLRPSEFIRPSTVPSGGPGGTAPLPSPAHVMSLTSMHAAPRAAPLPSPMKEWSNPAHATPTRRPDNVSRAASQARRSLLALTRTRSGRVRDRAFEILYEALDTNPLAIDDAEVASLLLLIGEMSDAIEAEVLSHKARSGEHLVEIGWGLERLLMRLEYACEVKAFLVPVEIVGAFQRLAEDIFPSIDATDPYVAQIVASVSESISWLLSPKPETEELMACPIALSLLSQIIRMAPPDFVEMEEPFSGILKDLHEKREWHLGGKFIKLLSSAAVLNGPACRMFISLMKGLVGRVCWQWIYLSIHCLGILVLASESPLIRKCALADGLFTFVETEDPESVTDASDTMTSSADSNNAGHAWRVRAAAVTALAEVYRVQKSDPPGLLAREALLRRRERERHPHVMALLGAGLGGGAAAADVPAPADAPSPDNSLPLRPRGSYHPHLWDPSPGLGPCPAPPLRRPLRRLSFLFQSICSALAETYAASQSRYAFLRKYLRTTDRKTLEREREASAGVAAMTAARRATKADARRRREGAGAGSEPSQAGGDSQAPRAVALAETMRAMTLAGSPRSRSPAPRNSDDAEGASAQPPTTKVAAVLSPSLLSSHPYAGAKMPLVPPAIDNALIKPSNGTVNRRKLFNAQRPEKDTQVVTIAD
ncbi:hypothetical protein BDK51DRAFT_29214, partial [Blyttiomyces helicus]